MTSAVLYGTTSDNELRPVQVTDSGEFVTDGGGGGDWYENFYVGGTEGAPSISLLLDGSAEFAGTGGFGGTLSVYQPTETTVIKLLKIQSNVGGLQSTNAYINAAGDVYARNFIDTDGYDLSKIGHALSAIHDVLESVDDLHGLKNLLHHLLDNLKSDPTPPEPPEPPTP